MKLADRATMIHRIQWRIASSITVILTTSVLGCGGTVSEDVNPDQGASGSPNTGGNPNTDGNSHENVTCSDIVGTFELTGKDVVGKPPRVWIHEQADGACHAMVSSKGFPGRNYIVQLAANTAVLMPQFEPATGGRRGITNHTVVEWKQITLDLENGTLGTTATAEMTATYYSEDSSKVETVLLDLTVVAPEPTTLEVEETMLPWGAARILASTPIESVAALLIPPNNQWNGTDKHKDNSVGIIQSEFRFSGPWDDIRGKTLEFNVFPTSLDLGGEPISTRLITVPVYQIGPALQEHTMSDTSTVATWNSVSSYSEGDCATLGCVIIQGDCEKYAGLAGQLLTKGATKVILSMRLYPSGSYLQPPSKLTMVSVVDSNGDELNRDQDEPWDLENVKQVWTYDTQGSDVVGFVIQNATYCHGWDWGPIIVESVRAE